MTESKDKYETDMGEHVTRIIMIMFLSFAIWVCGLIVIYLIFDLLLGFSTELGSYLVIAEIMVFIWFTDARFGFIENNFLPKDAKTKYPFWSVWVNKLKARPTMVTIK